MFNLDAAPVAQSILEPAPWLQTPCAPPHKTPSSDLTILHHNMTTYLEKRLVEKPNRSRGRVLIVTDEDQPRLYELLEAKGIDVVGVSTGTAAIVSLQRSRPHLVVANPKATGLSIHELAKMLEHSDNGIPLVLAGNEPSNRETRMAALSEGAFDYFELPSEIELLVKRSEQLIALRQKIEELRADADLDYLTGLANRRRFRVALVREVERWRRYGVPCALLLLDIDHLKHINDRFGHPAGDLVIHQLADTMTRASRDNDLAARL